MSTNMGNLAIEYKSPARHASFCSPLKTHFGFMLVRSHSATQMKLCCTIALLVTIPGTAFAYPTLSVDDAHSQMNRPDGTEAPSYELTPARGVILDVSNYKFQIPPQFKFDAPDSVHVLISSDRLYSADWKPRDGKQTLDASNLKPMKQSKPFDGLKSGDTVIFGIGHNTVEGDTLTLSIIWI